MHLTNMVYALSLRQLGHTPLNIAAGWGHEAVVRLLLARGAHIEAPNIVRTHTLLAKVMTR
jgi:ankyrin repeat protein